jgi:hypothetical protein
MQKLLGQSSASRAQVLECLTETRDQAELAIASFLLPHERREPAQTLRRALGRISTPPPAC